jgi:hypothetical protein
VTKYFQTVALVFAFALASTPFAAAQDKPAAPAAPKPARVEPPLIPLKLQILVSRYQGEKKISSLPYNLSVTAGSRGSLRMGAKVPVMMMMMTNMPKDAPAGGPVTYQDIGTSIDANVMQPTEDGRFRVEITIDDNSVYGDESKSGSTAPPPGNPTFRSFRASDSMSLKDGQTAQFTAATDKVSGEIVRVEVTLTVVK